jgi:hypothetical protein
MAKRVAKPTCANAGQQRTIAAIADPYPGLRIISTPETNLDVPSVVEAIKHVEEEYHNQNPVDPLIVIEDM